MGGLRKRVRNQRGFGSVVLALMNGGKPYEVPPPKKGGGNPASKPDQGKVLFTQGAAISHTETSPEQSLVVTRRMSPSDVEAFVRFNPAA